MGCSGVRNVDGRGKQQQREKKTKMKLIKGWIYRE